MVRVRDPARRFFYANLRDSERAAFEAGIALATAYHYLQGMPLPRSRASIRSLLKSLSSALMSQPFRERVNVSLKMTRPRRGVYSYERVGPRNLEVRVVVKYGGCRVWARLGWVEELNYPLMRIEKVSEETERFSGG